MQRPAVERDPADAELAERDGLRIEAVVETVVGKRAHGDGARGFVSHPDRHRRRRHDFRRGLGDRGQRLVVVERGGDEAIEPGEETETRDPLLGIAHQARRSPAARIAATMK